MAPKAPTQEDLQRMFAQYKQSVACKEAGKLPAPPPHPAAPELLPKSSAARLPPSKATTVAQPSSDPQSSFLNHLKNLHSSSSTTTTTPSGPQPPPAVAPDRSPPSGHSDWNPTTTPLPKHTIPLPRNSSPESLLVQPQSLPSTNTVAMSLPPTDTSAQSLPPTDTSAQSLPPTGTSTQSLPAADPSTQSTPNSTCTTTAESVPNTAIRVVQQQHQLPPLPPPLPYHSPASSKSSRPHSFQYSDNTRPKSANADPSRSTTNKCVLDPPLDHPWVHLDFVNNVKVVYFRPLETNDNPDAIAVRETLSSAYRGAHHALKSQSEFSMEDIVRLPTRFLEEIGAERIFETSTYKLVPTRALTNLSNIIWRAEARCESGIRAVGDGQSKQAAAMNMYLHFVYLAMIRAIHVKSPFSFMLDFYLYLGLDSPPSLPPSSLPCSPSSSTHSYHQRTSFRYRSKSPPKSSKRRSLALRAPNTPGYSSPRTANGSDRYSAECRNEEFCSSSSSNLSTNSPNLNNHTRDRAAHTGYYTHRHRETNTTSVAHFDDRTDLSEVTSHSSKVQGGSHSGTPRTNGNFNKFVDRDAEATNSLHRNRVHPSSQRYEQENRNSNGYSTVRHRVPERPTNFSASSAPNKNHAAGDKLTVNVGDQADRQRHGTVAEEGELMLNDAIANKLMISPRRQQMHPPTDASRAQTVTKHVPIPVLSKEDRVTFATLATTHELGNLVMHPLYVTWRWNPIAAVAALALVRHGIAMTESSIHYVDVHVEDEIRWFRATIKIERVAWEFTGDGLDMGEAVRTACAVCLLSDAADVSSGKLRHLAVGGETPAAL